MTYGRKEDEDGDEGKEGEDGDEGKEGEDGDEGKEGEFDGDKGYWRY
jgi:hypothetical protein